MILPQELAAELLNLVDQFQKDPTNPRFKECISFGAGGRYSVMIWSPIKIYSLTGLICPFHNCPISPCMLTSDFEKQHSRRNPRLVTSLSRNIILIQQIYRCRDGPGHDLYSCSEDVLCSLPDTVKKRIPFKMFYRSAYHLDLIDYIFDQISKGNNFSQISESVADLHLADYLRHGGCEDEFFTEELTRYPSHENVSSFHLILI